MDILVGTHGFIGGTITVCGVCLPSVSAAQHIADLTDILELATYYFSFLPRLPPTIFTPQEIPAP